MAWPYDELPPGAGEDEPVLPAPVYPTAPEPAPAPVAPVPVSGTLAAGGALRPAPAAPAEPAPAPSEQVDFGGGGEPAGPPQWDYENSFSGVPEWARPESQRLSTAQELGRGLVRGVVENAYTLEVVGNQAIAAIEDYFGVDWVGSDAKERAKEYKQKLEEFRQEWAPEDPTFAEAWRNAGIGGVLNHAVGQVAGMAPEMLPIFRANRIPTIAGYFGMLGGMHAAEQTDGDPAAIATGFVTGAATGGASQAVLLSEPFKQTVANFVAKAVGLGAAGAGGVAAQPAVEAAAGKKPYELPGFDQFLEGIGLNVGTFAALHGAQRLARGRPGETPPAAETPPVEPPPVEPAVADALRTSMPPPGPGNDLLRLPAPGGPGMEPRLTAQEPLGGPSVRAGAAAPDVIELPDAAAAEALRLRLPPPGGPGMEPRLPPAVEPTGEAPPRTVAAPPDVIPVPPEPGQRPLQLPPPGGAGMEPRLAPAVEPIGEAPPRAAGAPAPDVLPVRPEPGQTQPRLPAPGEVARLPEPTPENRAPTPEVLAVKPEPGQVSPADIVPRVRAPETAPETPPETRPADRYAEPGRWTTEPDHTVPGQYVAKNTAGEVIGVGDSAGQALRMAKQRAAEAAPAAEPTTPVAAPKTVSEALKAGEKPKAAVEKVKAAKKQTAARVEEAVAEAVGGKPAGIPLLITRAQRAELRARGHTPEQIRQMKPAEAHEILSKPVSAVTGGRQARQAEPKLKPTSVRPPEKPAEPRPASPIETGRQLVRELLADSKASVKAAIDRYGSPTGRGRPRSHADLHDYVDNYIRELEAAPAIDPRQAGQLKKAYEAIKTSLRASGKETSPRLEQFERKLAATDRDATLTRLREIREDLRQRMGKEAPPRGGGAAPRNAPLSPTAASLQNDVLHRPVRERLLRQDAEGSQGSLHDYLDDIIKHAPAQKLDPELVRLARDLRRLAPDTPVMSHETGAREFGDARMRGSMQHGTYWPDHEAITLHPRSGELTNVVLHEAVHRVTANYYDNLMAKVQRGERLTRTEARHKGALEAIQRELDDLRGRRAYSAEEQGRLDYARVQDELITMGLSDPQFRSMLAEHQPSERLRAELKNLGYEPRRSLWEYFRDTIGSILGRSPSPRNDTLLDRVVGPLRDITEAGGRYEAARSRPLPPRAEFGPRHAPGRVVTDDLPDQRARSTFRPFGDFIRDNFGVDVGKAATDLNARGLNRKAWLHMSSAEEMARWNPEIRAPLERIHESLRSKDAEYQRFIKAPLGEASPRDPSGKPRLGLADEVDMMQRELAVASPELKELMTEVGSLPNDGMKPIGVAARLGHRDGFDAANRHLDPTQLEAARALDAKFQALSPEEQALYGWRRNFHERLNRATTDAEYQGIAARLLPDFTPEDHATLARSLRTEKGLNDLLNNFDASDIHRQAGERAMNHRPTIEQIAKARQTGHIEGDYFSHHRWGDHLVISGDKGVSEGPNRYRVEAYESRSEAIARHKALVDAGETDAVYKTKDAYNARDAIPPQAIDMLEKQLKARQELSASEVAALKRGGASDEQIARMQRGRLSEDEIAAVRDSFTAMVLRNATRGAQARSRPRRSGTAGADTDAARAVREDMRTSASRVSHLKHAPEEAEARAALKRRVDELAPGRVDGLSYEDYARVKDVHDEVVKRVAPVDGDAAPNKVAQLGTKLSFIDQLMRVVQPILQHVEGNIRSEAFLGAHFGYGRTTGALARAISDIAPSGFRAGMQNTVKAIQGEMHAADWDLSRVIANRLKGKLTEQQHAAFMNMLEREGVFSHSLTMEMRAMARPGGFDTTSTRAGRVANNMMDMYTAGAHSADVVHKTSSALAGFRMALAKNKGDVEASIAEVKPLLRRIAPNTAEWNAPRFVTPRGRFGQFGAPILQYKVAAMQLYSTMATLAKTAATRGAEGHEARKALLSLMAINSAIVGPLVNVFGGVTVSTALGAYDWLNGRDKPHDYSLDVRRLIADQFGKPAGDFAAYGLAGTLAGVSVGRNISLANAGGIPAIDSFDQRGYFQFLGQLGGPWMGFATQKAEAAHAMLQGNWSRGMELMLPRAPRDVFRAVRDVQTGLVDTHGQVIRAPEQTSIGAAIGTALGANTTERADFYTHRNAAVRLQQEVAEDRKHTMDAILRSRDPAHVRELITRYNADPTHRMSPLNMGHVIKQREAERKQLMHPEDYGRRVSQKQRQFYREATNF